MSPKKEQASEKESQTRKGSEWMAAHVNRKENEGDDDGR